MNITQLSHLQCKCSGSVVVVLLSIPYYTSSCPLCLLTSDLSQFSHPTTQLVVNWRHVELKMSLEHKTFPLWDKICGPCSVSSHILSWLISPQVSSSFMHLCCGASGWRGQNVNCKASTGGRVESEGQSESGLGVCALEESGHQKDRPIATSMVFWH